MTDLASVVRSWRRADPKHIHPTREHVSEQAYWESGKPQAELVLELLPNGGTVLDFGCGDGRIAIPLAKLGFSVYVADAAPEMIERVQHQAIVQDADLAGSFVWNGSGNGSVLSFHVDAVNARAVFIHHSHSDVERMVTNLASCLKRGGYLIADWPVGEHHERIDWIDVTTWDYEKRQAVADAAGLELVTEGIPTVRPSVWVKQ